MAEIVYNPKTKSFDVVGSDPTSEYLYEKYVDKGWRKDFTRRYGSSRTSSTSSTSTDAEELLRIAAEQDAQKRAAEMLESQRREAESKKSADAERRREQITNERSRLTVSKQVTAVSDFRQTSKGTQMTEAAPMNLGPIYFEPTIYTKSSGFERDPVTGKQIPFYDIRYSGGAVDSGLIVEDRPATQEEIDIFKQSSLSIQPGQKETAFGIVTTKASELGYRFEKDLQPVANAGQKVEDVLVEANKKQLSVIYGESKVGKNLGDIEEGIIRGVVPNTPSELIGTGVSFALGGLTGAGLKAAGAGAARFLSPAATEVASISLGTGALGLGAVYGTSKLVKYEMAEDLTGKGMVIGELSRELITFDIGFKGGGKAFDKALGIYRTRGRTEISSDVVIAKEYPSERYPTIKKGQSAGSLLKEFTVIKELGEVSPAGFTAAPKPLKGSTFLEGSSELPGFYQSPRLNPTFLKMGAGESPKFDLDILPGLPTIYRTTPSEYALTPFVKSSQTQLAPLKPTKEFFYSNAEKGKAYVTFIKTEKEAVIPFDTGFKIVGKEYYVKINDIRIPIEQLRTVPGPKTRQIKGKQTDYLNVEDIMRSYRSSYKSSGGFKGLSYLSGSNSINRSYFSISRSLGSISDPYPSISSGSYRSSRGSKSPYKSGSYYGSPAIPDVPYYPSGSKSKNPLSKSGIGGFIPGLGFGPGPSRRRKSKRKLRRQVSLIASELGIKKSQSKLMEETGIAIRGL